MLLLAMIAWQMANIGVVGKVLLLGLSASFSVYFVVENGIKAMTLTALLLLSIGALGYQPGVLLNAYLVDLLPFLMLLTTIGFLESDNQNNFEFKTLTTNNLVFMFLLLIVSLLLSSFVFGGALIANGRLNGPLGGPVTSIYVLALIVPLLARSFEKPTVFLISVAVFMLIVMVLTKSRMPLGAFIVAAGTLVVLNFDRMAKRYVIPVFGLVVTIVVLAILQRAFVHGFSLSLSAIGLSGREYIWATVLHNMEVSRWFGYGFGDAYKTLSDAGMTGGLQPHSEYIRIYHNQGLVGLFGFAATVGYLVYRLVKAYLVAKKLKADRVLVSSALALWGAFLALALTDNVLIYPFYMLILFWYTAAALSTVHKLDTYEQ